MGNRGFVRSAGVVSACTLFSRVLGLARDMLSSHVFGTLPVWDAFVAAFRIPNLFRRLFGEGALTAAFLPAFVERHDGGREGEAHALLEGLGTVLALFLGVLAAAGIGVTFLLPRDPKTVLMAPLLRIMLPYLPIICLAALLGAALNGMRHYFTPAFAPALLNLVWIGTLFAFVGDVRAVAWAVVAGGALELLVMIPPLWRRGVHLRPRWAPRDPALREVGRRFVPLAFGLAPAQINELVGTLIAQYLAGAGAASVIYYGNQLTQLPLALVGTAVATAVYPLLASPKEDFRGVLRDALGLVLFVSVPATVGLIVLARPIVSLLFEHGRFGPEDTLRTAWVVGLYSAGLWCYCSNQVQVRAFYARKDTVTPVRVSAAMVALNLGLSLGLVGILREKGIALSNSVTGLATFVTLNVLLRRREKGLDLGPVTAAFLRALGASLLMGAAAWGVFRLMAALPGTTLALRLARVLVPVGAGAAVYFLLARLLGMREARLLLGEKR